MSRILPILFNTEMVQAILDGRKTVTRRIVKPHVKISCEGLENECAHEKGFFDTGDNDWACKQSGCGITMNGRSIYHAPYQIGDILYVRETWKYYEKAQGYGENFSIEKRLAYKADECRKDVQKSCEWYDGKWRPSIHMPKEAARIWLKVTDVRVERLQDITNAEILAEGINKETIDCYIRQMPEETEEWIRPSHLLAWSELWDSTVREEWKKWENNPWVWVIKFERCEKTG